MSFVGPDNGVLIWPIKNQFSGSINGKESVPIALVPRRSLEADHETIKSEIYKV